MFAAVVPYIFQYSKCMPLSVVFFSINNQDIKGFDVFRCFLKVQDFMCFADFMIMILESQRETDCFVFLQYCINIEDSKCQAPKENNEPWILDKTRLSKTLVNI